MKFKTFQVFCIYNPSTANLQKGFSVLTILSKNAKCFTSAIIGQTTWSAFICSKLTIETLDRGVKYVQS